MARDADEGMPSPADEDLGEEARGVRLEWQAHALKQITLMDCPTAAAAARLLAPTGRNATPSLAGLHGHGAAPARVAGVDDALSTLRSPGPLRQDRWLAVAESLGWTFSSVDLEAREGERIADTTDARGRCWPVHASRICHEPGDGRDPATRSAMRRVERSGRRGVLVFTRTLSKLGPNGTRAAVYGGMTYDASAESGRRWSAFFLTDGDAVGRHGVDAALAQRGAYEHASDEEFWERCGMPRARADAIAFALGTPDRARPVTLDGRILDFRGTNEDRYQSERR